MTHGGAHCARRYKVGSHANGGEIAGTCREPLHHLGPCVVVFEGRSILFDSTDGHRMSP